MPKVIRAVLILADRFFQHFRELARLNQVLSSATLNFVRQEFAQRFDCTIFVREVFHFRQEFISRVSRCPASSIPLPRRGGDAAFASRQLARFALCNTPSLLIYPQRAGLFTASSLILLQTSA
jgi:hypothetical protein